MNRLTQISHDDDSQGLLFADLFAALLMTIIVLVNVHTSATTAPKNTSESGKNDAQAHLIYLQVGNQVSVDKLSNPPILISQLIQQLKNEESRVEVVVSTQNNGQEIFILFSALDAAGIDYSYSQIN